jgi:hypothetical protein
MVASIICRFQAHHYYTAQHKLERNLVLAGETELLFPVCKVSRYFLLYVQIQRLIEFRKLFRKWIKGRPVNPVMNVPVFSGPTLDFAFARWVLNARSRDVYVDSPNIVAYQVQMRPWGDEISLDYVFDVIFNDVGSDHRVNVNPF